MPVIDSLGRALSAEAQRLVDAAEHDPAATIALVDDLLTQRGADQHVTSTLLRARGIALRVQDLVDDALESFDRSVEAALQSGHEASLALARTSRAAALFQTGRVEDAMAELHDVLANGAQAVFGFALFQRASLLVRLGRFDDGERDISEALPILDAQNELRLAAHALSNRGTLRAMRGRFGEADADLRDALARYEAMNAELAAADTVHNLGYVAHRRGDLVGAQRLYSEGEARRRAIGVPTTLTELDRAEALIETGLATEALTRALALAEDLDATGNSLDAGEALYLAASAAQMAGQHEHAAKLAELARARFDAHRQGHMTSACDIIMLRCALLGGVTDETVVQQILALDGRLTTLDDAVRRDEGSVLCAEAHLSHGNPAAALAALSKVDAARCSIALQARLFAARALANVALDRPVDARRALNAGLRRLDELRATFGSLELRAGLGTHVEGLQRASIALALRSGRPWDLVKSTEATRAGALRFPTGRPPDDPRLAEALEQLRAVERTTMRAGESLGADELAERRRLHRLVSDLQRTGAGESAATRCPTKADMRRALDGRRLAVLVPSGDNLLGVAVDRHDEVHRVGTVTGMREARRALAFNLARLARVTTSPRARQLAAEQTEQIASDLDELLAPALGSDTTQPVVLVPPADLLSFPWALLPGLRRRPFVVAPSVTVWHQCATAPSDVGRVALVAGPDLVHARDEVGDIAGCWPRAEQIATPSATVERVAGSADGAGLLHVSAHHHVNRDNPLFSGMRLDDGWLYGHDLLRLERAPHTVVLSVCEAAQADALGTDEALGTALAFLAAGTRSVIAASAPVPDTERTATLMRALHAELSRGATPADALCRARIAAADTGDDPAVWASFTCLGA